MFNLVPWRPLQAVVWDAFQSVIHAVTCNLSPGTKALPAKGVPVYIMLPLDVALPDPEMDNEKLHSYLKTLASIGVHGVMGDVWWRLCEPSPGVYDFSRYVTLAKTCESLNLKFQAVMSFHACGGNVGDSVNIPLPEWVLSAGTEHKFWFTDRAGNENTEYISFGADYEAVLPAAVDSDSSRPRTPLQAYGAFTEAFVKTMGENGLMGTTVTELQIGVGPCGELRYPNYPLSRWTFPGIGEFQCFDKYLLRELADTIREKGTTAVQNAVLPPEGTGAYNDAPYDTSFFTEGMRTEWGKFFLGWYSDRLLEHGEDVLRQVGATMSGWKDVDMALKVSGVHWWKLSASRAAEATCGYVGGDGRAVYEDIAKLCRAKGAILDFTCLEMRTIDQPLWARCGPRQLVAEVFRCAMREQVLVAGENALQTFERGAFRQMEYALKSTGAAKAGFTLLRLCDDLMQEDKLKNLTDFVERLRRIDAAGSS